MLRSGLSSLSPFFMLSNKIIHLLLKAQKLRDKKKHKECIELCQTIIKKSPNTPQAYELMGLSALDSHDFYLAESAGKNATRLEPTNPNGALIASVALTNISQDQSAIQILEDQLSRTPNIVALMFNLHACFANLGKNQQALEVALKTVQLEPTNADAFNNLGASLHAVNRLEDAAIAFKTAIDLNPKQFTARLNLVNTMVSDDTGKIIEINKTLEMFGDQMPERVKIGSLHNSAFAYLRVGDLKNGWERLEYGFSPLIDSGRGRRPQRSFNVPRWMGESLTNKTLMVWTEQGLGDGIMFGSVLPDLTEAGGKVIVECEPRLVKLFARSFPQYEVRSEFYRAVFPFDSPIEDFDVQIPFGSLGGIYRQSIQDFDKSAPYLKVDPDLFTEYANRIKAIAGNKKIIGLCWRSGVVSPSRGTGYTQLDDWQELISMDDVCVVNLQYGKCEEELLAIEKETGKQIIRWPDTDLQNDLDALAAIIKNLDLVCTVGTVVAQMGGALGVPTLLCALSYGYTSFGTNRFPYFPDIHMVVDENHKNILNSVNMATSIVRQLSKT